MNKIVTEIFIVSMLILVFGCEGEEGKRGLPAPILTGSITGTVSTAVKSDIGGIEAKIAETSQKALCDSLGNWTINDVKAGIYTLEFSRIGYGTSKILNYQFVGGGTARIGSTITLTKLPLHTATHLEIIDSPNDDAGQLSCTIEFDPQAPRNEQRLFRFYFSKDKNFIPSSSNYFYSTTYSGSQPNPFTDLTVRLNGIAGTLKNKVASSSMMPFIKGDTVYVVACASTTSGSAPQSIGSGYYDYTNFGQFVYTDITAATNTISFVLP
jgi:hypothetical protein